MINNERWWKKHTRFKSDPIIEMVEASPEKFMISRTEILQLVLDFKSLKNKFTNLCIMQDAADEWDALPDEEKERQRAEMDEITKELKKLFDKD